MYFVTPNPDMVQSEDWRRPDKTSHTTPVFLMHDGGGTIFSYHCLNPLGRYVYGIHNPYFRTGESFKGGLPQMARLYASWIKRTIGKRDFPVRRRTVDDRIDILLGGWSLGGLLSLEMARQLADDPVVRVVGILMIDSIYTGFSSLLRDHPSEKVNFLDAHARAMPSYDTNNKPRDDDELYDDVDDDDDDDDEYEDDARCRYGSQNRTQMLSRRCMAKALHMVAEWKLPQWEGRLAGQRPRAVLVRARQAVATPDGGPACIDRDRGDRTLGWDAYAEDMFEEVIDVDGNHFDIFAPDRLDDVSHAIKAGLDKLDQLQMSSCKKG